MTKIFILKENINNIQGKHCLALSKGHLCGIVSSGVICHRGFPFLVCFLTMKDCENILHPPQKKTTDCSSVWCETSARPRHANVCQERPTASHQKTPKTTRFDYICRLAVQLTLPDVLFLWGRNRQGKWGRRVFFVSCLEGVKFASCTSLQLLRNISVQFFLRVRNI